ncbi:MAG: hypothetical protein HKO68_03150 [Desulfobacterales bacterium]|nr:hypothetical protein [Desulfobacterales bacterium]
MRSNKRLSGSQRINRMMKLPASPTDMIRQKMEAALHAKGFRLAQDGEFLYHVDLKKYSVNRVGSGHPAMISGKISIHIKISASDGRLLATRAFSEEELKGGEGFFLDQSAGKVLESCLEKAVERSVSDPILLAALEHAAMDDSKPKEAFAAKALQSDTTPPEIFITSHDTSRGIRPVQSRKKVTISGKASDENDIAQITINSKDVIFDEAGNFKADVYLKMGSNQIVVSAKDLYENRASKKFTITRTAAKPTTETKFSKIASGEYYALVIGNNNYKFLRNLKTAIKDAREIIDILKVRFGFKTTLLLDASRKTIIGSLNNFRKKLGADDHFLIYYAGHGEFDKFANKAYWLPVDARSDDDTNWIIVDTITSNIRRIASKHVLVVSDSCYSGTLTRRAVSDFYSSEKRNIYLQKMLSKKSRTLLASGGNEPVSDLGGEGHSIFAKAFLLGLKNIDAKKFTAEELYIQYIKEMVAGSSEQTPEYNIIRNSGHEGGAFVFRRTN